jgi:hypothetical protein
MVFQMLALGPHWFQKLSSPDDPDPDPLSRPNVPSSPDDDDDADAPGDARLCNAGGIAVFSCDSADCAVPAGVPLVWVTAVAGPASPPGAVICWAGVNGLNWVVAAELPA